jgi:alkanesulfonate monooxygenase SsuD/methylene tetrahydromethanopterin reductase-like flavin-dependent oxidoreductase (luciferase family)
VQQVRRLLDGERLAPSFPGEHRALRLATDPAPQIPIHLAALGPAATRLAGELADGWCPFLLPCSALGDRIRILEQGTAASRQGRLLPQICPSVPVAVSPDDDDSRRIASWWVAFYLTSSCFAVYVDHVPAAAQAARTARVSCGVACSGHGLRNLAAMMTRRSLMVMSS